MITDLWARRWVRWAVLIPLWIATWGVGVVLWHLTLDHTWADSLTFAGLFAASQAAVQWWFVRTGRSKERSGQGVPDPPK